MCLTDLYRPNQAYAFQRCVLANKSNSIQKSILVLPTDKIYTKHVSTDKHKCTVDCAGWRSELDY